jgi:hypothetical protein
MDKKTIVAIIAGLFILVILFILIINQYSVRGISMFDVVIRMVDEAISKSPWLTGNMTDWPTWAQ